MRGFVVSAVAALALAGATHSAAASPTDSFTLFSVVQNPTFDPNKPVAVFDPANGLGGAFSDHIGQPLFGFGAPPPAEAKLDMTVTFTGHLTVSDGSVTPHGTVDITLTTGGTVLSVGAFSLADLADCADALGCSLSLTKSLIIPVAANLVGGSLDLDFNLAGSISGLVGGDPCTDCIATLDTASWSVKADPILYGNFTGTTTPGGTDTPPTDAAIPEPGSLALLATGMIGALGLGRRRRP